MPRPPSVILRLTGFSTFYVKLAMKCRTLYKSIVRNRLRNRIAAIDRNSEDITCRLAQAKGTFKNKKRLLTSNNVPVATGKSLSSVWSVALYASKTRTIGKRDNILEAFKT